MLRLLIPGIILSCIPFGFFLRRYGRYACRLGILLQAVGIWLLLHSLILLRGMP